MSKTKKRIETIREKLKELRHKLSKSELKEIKKHLYNIENKNELLELETTKEYLDELDEKILESDDDDFEFIGIENIQDLFKILIYKPTIVKSGYNNNYIEYKSEGEKLLTIEWKIQLTAQINFISSRLSSDETRVMHIPFHFFCILFYNLSFFVFVHQSYFLYIVFVNLLFFVFVHQYYYHLF